MCAAEPVVKSLKIVEVELRQPAGGAFGPLRAVRQLAGEGGFIGQPRDPIKSHIGRETSLVFD